MSSRRRGTSSLGSASNSRARCGTSRAAQSVCCQGAQKFESTMYVRQAAVNRTELAPAHRHYSASTTYGCCTEPTTPQRRNASKDWCCSSKSTA
jgi:hypothetical protein